MTLPLRDRLGAQKRAAHAAVTTCQTNGGKIVRYELETGIEKLLAERKPPIHLSHKIIHFSGDLRTKFRNYTHKIGTAIWRTDRDNLDIRTEDEKLTAWIASNKTIQDIMAGYQRARKLRDEFIYKVKAGLTGNMSEDELQATIANIRNCVPEPPDYVKKCHCKGEV